jgi:hypothetical protein
MIYIVTSWISGKDDVHDGFESIVAVRVSSDVELEALKRYYGEEYVTKVEEPKIASVIDFIYSDLIREESHMSEFYESNKFIKGPIEYSELRPSHISAINKIKLNYSGDSDIDKDVSPIYNNNGEIIAFSVFIDFNRNENVFINDIYNLNGDFVNTERLSYE